MVTERNPVVTVEVSIPAARGAVSYPVHLASGLLEAAGELIGQDCPAHRYVVIADSHVARLYGRRLLDSLERAGHAAILLEFPAGEWNKSRETWAKLTDGMLRSGVGRDSAVVALGGGVVGDVAGFVAATYMRGIPVVQVPTTLLAMIDSSVGGKTGVDTAAGKNLVGAFHQPASVLIDPTALTTLSAPERSSGLAEVLKHGLILDAEYYEQVVGDLPRLLDADIDLLLPVIRRSIEIKAGVVREDERERGYRQVLNFGHTVAHALEALSGYELRHGEAVALGLVAEARLGEAIGVSRSGLSERIREALELAGLPIRIEPDIDRERFMEAMTKDKKRRGGETRFTLVAEIGKVVPTAEGGWSHPIEPSVIEDVLFGAA